MEDHLKEIRRLQGCINDLISLMALPAMWSGHPPPHVLDTLVDLLLRVLGLDFVHARMKVAAESPSIEATRIARRPEETASSPEREAALQRWLRDASTSDGAVPNPIGAGEISIAHVWPGLGKETGWVMAGAQRAGFPTDLEDLFLKVAVNQAVMELQRAEVLAAERRVDETERLKKQVEAQNIYLRQESEQGWGEIVGRSGALKKALRLVEQVAPTQACALIQGETGTGKELIARAVHRLSGRSDHPFVKLNCAAIPTGLLEAELFGHEKGAFTGAIAQRVGRFEAANGGTIFLDEVGEIPLELQAKLLRVLQEQEFERLGSARTVRVDVRLIAASNRDLAQMVADQQFRSDLYYRLKVFPIRVPPLRERTDDIPLLVEHFTRRHARQCNKQITSIVSEIMTALCNYSWPGNIRELENFIERSVILSQGLTLEAPLGELKTLHGGPSEGATLEGVERDHILRALDESDWVIAGPSGAAKKLGLKRTSLQYKMQKLGISRRQA